MAFYPAHRISNSDAVRTGNAMSPNRTILGVPVAGKSDGRYNGSSLVLLSLGAPTLAAVNNIAASQAISGAADAVINGALATGTPAVAVLDVPRGVQVDSSGAGDTTQTVTVYGTDEYGQGLREAIALNGVTDVLGKKAFKTVTRVAVSAALAGNLTVGTTSKLGLAFRAARGGFVRGRLGEDTADAGTYVAPERTASTAITNDVRGTYAPAGTLDGAAIYTVLVSIDNGPADIDAYGIAQFNG